MDEKEDQNEANERQVEQSDVFKKINTKDKETLGILHKKVSQTQFFKLCLKIWHILLLLLSN